MLTGVVALAVYSPAHAQKPKRAHELYEKAQQEKTAAKRVQLLQQAAQLLTDDRSAAAAPENARQLANIHYALGREFYQQARWQPAIAHLEKALALDPIFLPALATLGLVYFQQGSYDAAIAAYEKVLRVQPTAQLYNNLGAAHEAKGDLAAAVAAYSRAVELDARLALAKKNLQRAQEKLSRTALSATLEKSASSDSLKLTTKSPDSLAKVTAKLPKGHAKSKTVKDGKGKAASSGAQTSVSISPDASPQGKKTKAPATASERQLTSNSPAALDKKNSSPAAAPGSRPPRQPALPSAIIPQPTPATKDDRIASSSFPFHKSDSGTVQITSAVSPVASQSSEALAHPSPILSAHPSVKPAVPSSSMPAAASSPSSLMKSAVLFICVLLALIAIAQRRRLGYAWLHLKPAFALSAATVSRQVRLLPSRLHLASVAGDKEANRVKLLSDPEKHAPSTTPLEAESPEPTPASSNESNEPRQPSLQTQAFFAEMIAGEPEIEEFDENVVAKFDKAALSTNGHVESTPNDPSLSDIFKDAEALRSRLAPSDSAAVHHQSVQAGLAKSAAISKSDSAIDSTEKSAAIGEQLSVNGTQSPVTSSQQRPATSRTPAHREEMPPQRDNELPATANDQQVLGRYLIERKIGKGAMGNIYLAFDPKLDRRVVIKTVCFNLATSDTDTLALKDRVYREARAIAKLGHPNIVVVYDVEDDKDMSYIVMEHIEGQDLRQALASEHHFDHPRALKIVAQVCSALDYAHQAGIIHRDIKPSNIMLLPGDKAKVTDFGIAKIADNFSLTLPGHVLGTPSYMAPEQFEGEEIDGRADIFSLGVVLYELLTGGRPFAGDSLASLAYKIVHKMHIPPSLQNVELPLELDEIVGRALAKNPAERYATALEFREALLALPMEAAHSKITIFPDRLEQKEPVA